MAKASANAPRIFLAETVEDLHHRGDFKMSSAISSVPEARSVSQFSEDILVWDFFARKRDGFFIEVGANEPRNLSQTWLLEQNGWQGILVEPQAVCCARLREQRRAKVFQVACCAPEQKGTVEFHIATDSVLSSLERNDAEVQYAKTEIVQALPLDEVLAQAGAPPIDFISIDVEGAEMHVLKGFSIEKHRPALLLIEDHLENLDVHFCLSRRGYKLVKRIGCNNWYVPADSIFPGVSFAERIKLFRKLWLGTPLRAFRSRLKKRKAPSH